MKIINLKIEKCPHAVYVGRPSPLGNPFAIGRDGDRKTVIRKYRHWLWRKIQDGDQKVLSALRALTTESTLACWCHPLPCHAEIVSAAWGYLKMKGDL